MARGADDLAPSDIAISEATADAIHAAGKQVFVGHMLNRSRAVLMAWANHEQREFIPIRLVPQLEKLGTGQDGWPHITRALAQMQGFELFRLPETDGGADDWLAQIGLLSSEAADITGTICSALGDGAVCGDDVRRLNMIDAARQLVSVAVGLVARLEAVAQE